VEDAVSTLYIATAVSSPVFVAVIAALIAALYGPGVPWRRDSSARSGTPRGVRRKRSAKQTKRNARKKKPESSRPRPAAAPAEAATAAASSPSFQSYSKFDFVPGERIVAAEDFAQDAIGDFPAKWNTNASGEIVTIAGQPGRWLKLTKAGFFTRSS
jgi:hypothetical protein